jgi:hypothetical protein
VEVLQGVRQMRFEGLLGRNERCELSRRKWRTCWGVGGAVQVLADRPRDRGPERFREHLIGKLSSREPSTIKGPGRSHWSTCVERDHQSVPPVTAGACRSGRTCESSMACPPPLRSGIFGMGRRMWSLIGPKDIVSHGRVSNLP